MFLIAVYPDGFIEDVKDIFSEQLLYISDNGFEGYVDVKGYSAYDYALRLIAFWMCRRYHVGLTRYWNDFDHFDLLRIAEGALDNYEHDLQMYDQYWLFRPGARLAFDKDIPGVFTIKEQA